MVLSPEEVVRFRKEKIYRIGNSIIEFIDAKIREYEFDDDPWIHISIPISIFNDINFKVLEYIAYKYTESGWYRVIFRDSKEENRAEDRIIEFIFCTKKTYKKWVSRIAVNPYRDISQYHIFSYFHIVLSKILRFIFNNEF